MDRRVLTTRPAPRLERGDDWRDYAACQHEDPELFQPPGSGWAGHKDQANAAIAVCKTKCPVIDQCLEWALRIGDDFAIAGGTTPRMRRAMKKQSSTTKTAAAGR